MQSFFCLILIIYLSSCSTSSKDKEKANLLLERGISFSQNGNFASGLRDLLKAEEYDPKNPLIQNNLGLLYFEREHFDKAEKHLRNAIALEPKYSDARNNLARVLIEEKKYRESEEQLDIVINDLTYGNTEKALFHYGLSKFNQKLFNEALIYFGKSLKAKSDNCIALTYLGRSYFEIKNYSYAAEALDKAVGFCQKVLFDEPHYYSALTFYRLGEKEKSKARFEEIIKLYPNGTYRDKSKAMLDLLRKVD